MNDYVNKKILFICYGNVARSQMAEAYYNVYTKSNDASSAGVSNDSFKKYSHPVSNVVKLMNEDNIDVSSFKVKKLTPEMIDVVSKVVVLCDISDCPKYLLDSKKMVHIPIADPYDLDLEYARAVRDEVKRTVLNLISELN